MAFTLEQLEALEEAYATGALTIKYADKEVTYRSQKDLEAAIANVRAALGLDTRPSQKYAYFNSGSYPDDSTPDTRKNW